MRKRTQLTLIVLAELILAAVVTGPLGLAQTVGVKGLAPGQCTPGSWVNKAPYPLSVYGAAMATDGNHAYVFGGVTIGGPEHAEANRYDPVTDSWTPLAPSPFGADALLHGEYGGNGKIYFMGGHNFEQLNRVYDIATNAWSAGASIPAPASEYGHAFWNGKIYVIGGLAVGIPTNAVSVYDVAADSWTALAPLPQAEYGMATGVIDGKIYVAGGATTGNFALTNLYIYDIGGNSWTSGPPMTIGASYSASTVVGGTLWVLGGGNPLSLAITQTYDPTTSNWSQGPDLNQRRFIADAVTLNAPGGETALIVGGFDSSTGSSLNSVEGNTSSCITDLFLHGTSTNPSVLFLDTTRPTAGDPKVRDSGVVKLAGGNVFQPIGAWPAAPSLLAGTLTRLQDLHVFLGLKNSDDTGTRYDVRAEVLKNGAVVASGLALCVTGLVRDPGAAREVGISFTPFTPVSFNGTTDTLSLRVLARIGTTVSGTPCGGHVGAVGLRLYFDAVSRESRFGGVFGP